MPIRNFLKMESESTVCHNGTGLVNITGIYNEKDFNTPLRFVHFTVLPPGASIGLHAHGNDEEIYVILEGNGVMELDGQKVPVSAGDTALNKPFGTHALYNTSDSTDMKVLIFEVTNER